MATKTPLKLYWVITNHCNLHCRYCYYNSGLEKKVFNHNLDQDAFKLAKKIASKFSSIVFTGGEPLLFPGIFRLISFFKNQGLKVAILTNGVYLTKSNCQRLINLRLDQISISLDSLDVKVNDFLRGQSKQILAGIKNLLALRPYPTEIEIMQTVTNKNINSIKKLIAFCQKRKLKLWLDPVEINPNLAHLADLSLFKLNKQQKSQLRKLLHDWAGNDCLLENYVNNWFNLLEKKSSRNIFCPMGSSSFVLDPDGYVYPCFLRKDLRLGNLYQDSIDQILADKALKQQSAGLQAAACLQLGCLCMTISTQY